MTRSPIKNLNVVRFIKGAILFFSIGVIPITKAFGQADAGLWIGASATKQITRQFDVTGSAQVRFDQNISALDVLLADAGIEYSVSKKVRASLHYRFISSNQINYYSKRHRFYVDLSYRQRVNIITLTLRERIQQQFDDYYSSETGKIPEWIIRSKLAAKIDLQKKITPYVSVEAFYLLDNVNEEDQLFTRMRYETGVLYEYNRMHSISPYILFQHDMISASNEIIYGINYDVAF